jgi:hypothetical protein
MAQTRRGQLLLVVELLILSTVKLVWWFWTLLMLAL